MIHWLCLKMVRIAKITWSLGRGGLIFLYIYIVKKGCEHSRSYIFWLNHHEILSNDWFYGYL